METDEAVVIIEIPESIWVAAKKKHHPAFELMDSELAIYRRRKGVPPPYDEIYTLKPQFIVGYIDRRNNSVHLSPRYKWKPPVI